MALKGKLMAMSYLPVDEQVLAALGCVTIRHGFLDWTLNRTIKTLLGIKPEQADFAFAGEGSASLRRKILRIAAAKFQKGSETYRQLARIINDCQKATDQRNDLTHCVWVTVEAKPACSISGQRPAPDFPLRGSSMRSPSAYTSSPSR